MLGKSSKWYSPKYCLTCDYDTIRKTIHQTATKFPDQHVGDDFFRKKTKKQISGPKVWYGAKCKCRIHAKSKTKVSPAPTILFCFFLVSAHSSEWTWCPPLKDSHGTCAASLGSFCSSLRHFFNKLVGNLHHSSTLHSGTLTCWTPKMEVWFRWSSFLSSSR